MSNKLIHRRHAIQVGGAAIAAVTIPGCGAVATASRVVVNLPWANITKIASAILSLASGALTIKALVEEVTKTMNATLDDKQVAALDHGGELIVRSKDGEEFSVPFTIQ